MVACAGPMSPKLCSINIDLDEIPNYWAIHGLADAATGSTTAAYDSSVFPCPAYMALKDAAIASYALLGRPSRSVVDTPSVLTAPTQPYRVGTPYWKRGDGMLEIPIQVTRALRLPYFGTPLMMA